MGLGCGGSGSGLWGGALGLGSVCECEGAGTVAKGMGVAGLSSGFECGWAASVALLVKYMRHGYVDMAYMVYEFFVHPLDSLLNS